MPPIPPPPPSSKERLLRSIGTPLCKYAGYAPDSAHADSPKFQRRIFFTLKF